MGTLRYLPTRGEVALLEDSWKHHHLAALASPVLSQRKAHVEECRCVSRKPLAQSRRCQGAVAEHQQNP